MRKVLLTALLAASFCTLQAHPTSKRPIKPTALLEQNPITNNLLSYAKKHLSTRYRSGGTTPGGFDCSGFTRFCYEQLGISLPHSSAAQSIIGKAVKKEAARPGDLIFFKGHSAKGSSVGHVGMIVEVDDHRIKFIHSASKGGVRYDWLNASYYRNGFVGIRRVASLLGL